MKPSRRWESFVIYNTRTRRRISPLLWFQRKGGVLGRFEDDGSFDPSDYTIAIYLNAPRKWEKRYQPKKYQADVIRHRRLVKECVLRPAKIVLSETGDMRLKEVLLD